MAKIQLKDLPTAEQGLNGQEYVYISQEDKTRKTTINDISEFTNNKITPHLNQLSNSNLLINGDFKINQRSEDAYTIIGKSKYTVDRWISYNLTSDTTEITKLDNGIKVKSKSGGSARLRQWLESDDTKRLVGKTVTFSIKVMEDCTQCTFSVIKDRESAGDVKVFSSIKAGDILSHTFKVTSDFTQLGVQFSTIDTNGIIVEYAKLELGSKPTPFIPRLCAEELALCKRYYRNYDVDLGASNFYGYAHDTTALSITMNFDTPMRIVPTFTLKNNTIRRNSNGEILTLSGFSKNISPYGLATMYLIKANIPLVTGQTYSINGTFDAEIY